MDKLEFVINHIYELYQMGVRTIGDQAIYPKKFLKTQDPLACNPSLFQSICSNHRTASSKASLYEDQEFLYSVISMDTCYVIVGPVSLNRKTNSQIDCYFVQNMVENPGLRIPQYHRKSVEQITSFLYGILQEDYDESENLFQKDMVETNHCRKQEDTSRFRDDNSSKVEVQSDSEYRNEEIHWDLAEYLLNTSEEEQIHFSFEEEKKQAEQIIYGDYGANIHRKDEANIYSKKFIGKMAKTPIKQVEYECVCWITLMTRYAIEAGVSDAKSYALSDVTLQNLSVAKTTVEMRHVFDESMKEFDALIKEAKALKGKESPYIEQCKDYIAKHVYEKITLEDLAKEVGLHPVYLSRLFSMSIGKPVSLFIMEEKVKISCNLLKYSGKSIADIAEYMNLSPQSYFTRVFKKVMSQSPAQYRKEHRDKKFYED
ncbi:MAG: AraC family transcriptional regulator [Clostridiales bacterium]|nr:AraC family transcriptional regulator [Clostridiales bacterium]